jgi:SMC interacting uncharacterized protein involved in chromosome segregation
MSDITLKLYTQKEDANVLKLYDDFGIDYNNNHYKCIFREIENYDELVKNYNKSLKNIDKLNKEINDLKIINDLLNHSHDNIKELHTALKEKTSKGRWITVKRTGTEKVFVTPDDQLI